MRDLYRSIAKHYMVNRGATRINKKNPKTGKSFFATYWKKEVNYDDQFETISITAKPKKKRRFLKGAFHV